MDQPYSVLLVATIAAMYVLATPYYGALRKAAGLPYFAERKQQPPVAPVSGAEIAAMLASPRHMQVLLVGLAGFVLVLFLMMFKPF